ncbi:MAG: DUF302 domain-containing protein [Acidobacteriota bacterium]|nr:DUF302 domain-containing protein [Acidobacteriota bacterium]
MCGDNGLTHLKCGQPAQETAARLEAALAERGLRIFARIDHSKAAAEMGLDMRPTEVLLFGKPAVGTPMMAAAPTLAIDLPHKALVWEDENSKVLLTYNVPEYLKRRHGIPETLIKNLNGLADFLRMAVK